MRLAFFRLGKQKQRIYNIGTGVCRNRHEEGSEYIVHPFNPLSQSRKIVVPDTINKGRDSCGNCFNKKVPCIQGISDKVFPEQMGISREHGCL